MCRSPWYFLIQGLVGHMCTSDYRYCKQHSHVGTTAQRLVNAVDQLRASLIFSKKPKQKKNKQTILDFAVQQNQSAVPGTMKRSQSELM